VAAHGVHMDESNYPNPTSFQPFRFVDKTKENAGRKVGMTAIQADWLAFGYGRRACPGRIFATTVFRVVGFTDVLRWLSYLLSMTSFSKG